VHPKLEDAVSHLAEGNAALHAGARSARLSADGLINAGKVVSLSAIKDLAGVQETVDGGLVIGALTTISEIAGHPLVQGKYPGLSQAASEVASPQLRNQGTIGGNLCQKPRCWYYRGEFPCLRKGGERCYAFEGENQFHAIFGHDGICAISHPSDTAPMLAALRARVRVVGPAGGRRTVAVENCMCGLLTM
jgi:xanthine dehydrogenase YagS FAD-binding subunit